MRIPKAWDSKAVAFESLLWNSFTPAARLAQVPVPVLRAPVGGHLS